MMQRHQLMAVLLLASSLLGTSHAVGVSESEYSRGAQRSAPAWLVRNGVGEVRTTGTSEPASRSSTTSGWRTAGIYGLEFGGAALGTAFAGAALVGTGWAMVTFGHVPEEGQVYAGLIAGAATILVYNPVLTGTGTHFGGSLAGQRGSFWHTLVGSLAGSIAGTALAYGYNDYWTSRHNYYGTTQNVITLSCVVVPTWVGAIVAHNAWR